MAKILLVEPDFKNKYPPLGLMKISSYHKHKKDEVFFVKGKNKELRDKKWDRIYIFTLFTFYWKKTIDTIKYYYNSVEKPSDIHVGGVMASILYDDLRNESGIEGITIHVGLLDKPGYLGDDNYIVDRFTPDYSIIDPKTNPYLDYKYPVSDAYIGYATRGCIRGCKFCAVPILEPNFQHYVPLKDQVENIRKLYGEKRNLLLLDNNVLASHDFERIIHDIIDLGFGVDNNKYTYMKNNRKITARRYVDFNQGIDARLLTKEKMRLLSKIAIRPLRIAFDYATKEYIKLYIEKVRLAADYGIKNLSNYILYNYKDTPEDLYIRLKINVVLNEEFQKKGYKTKIWSFPMRYSPIIGERCKDRKYIGPNWKPKYIRTIQCILNATHGVVGPKKEFFNEAFGKDINEFRKILIMPEEYIIKRQENKNNGNIDLWWKSFNDLHDKKEKCLKIIEENKFKNLSIDDEDIYKVLRHYMKNKCESVQLKLKS